MSSIFSRFFSTSSQSSSVITTTTTSKTASSSAMVLPSPGTDDHYDEVDSNKKIKNNATDLKGKEQVRQRANAVRKLRKEFKDNTTDPPSFCSCGPFGTDDCNIFNWRGAIFGPDDTPFEGGVFFVLIRFREDYPYKPPTIMFLTKIFHPNIEKSGKINLDILREQWSPALTLSKMLISICSFLDDPNVDEAGNRIATIYREDRQKYNAIARAWTRKYAMGFTFCLQLRRKRGVKDWSPFTVDTITSSTVHSRNGSWILRGSSLKQLGRSLAVKPGLDGSKAELKHMCVEGDAKTLIDRVNENKHDGIEKSAMYSFSS